MPNPQGNVLTPMVWPAVAREGSPEDLEVTRLGNLHVLGLLRAEGGILGAGYGVIPENVWFVDDENGNDLNDGLCWGTAFKTIQRGINQARYGANTGALEYVIKNHHKFIFIRPGHYNITEYISFSGYGMHLIGLGAVPGKDYGVSINYDGAVAATGVIAFSGSNNSIHNIHIYTNAAIPGIYMADGDNNLIEGVVIEGNGTTSTYGIYAPSMKGSWIRDCVIQGMVTAGIYVPGGADKYFIHGGIVGNQIHSDATGAKGIHIAGPGVVVCYNARISHNVIDMVGAGATARGIDIDDTGVISTFENIVTMLNGAVGIDSEGSGVHNNHVSVNDAMVGGAVLVVSDGNEA